MIAIVALLILILRIILWVSLALTVMFWIVALQNTYFPYYLAIFPSIALLSNYLILILKKSEFT